jgi:glutamate-1-semialdehyde 2,1-aminomutase
MQTNLELFNKSKEVLPGGVNSPVRAMKPDYPFFTKFGRDCLLYDIEGQSYIDYCLGYGPLIFGHAPLQIVEAIKNQVTNGTIYGTPTELELEYAQTVTSMVPNVDMIRVVSTGTEATMNAIRLARGYTERSKIIKFKGGYHGAHDAVLVKAGSGALTHAVPDSNGIPPEIVSHTLLCEFNDIEALSLLFDKYKNEIACIVSEPILGNVGCILPEKGFLDEMRKLCTENDTLLFFDEVITGFRLGLGGGQEYFNVDADIVTLGKIAGGGLPIGIFGAKRKIMENITPSGKIYNAGTFNGNPLSVTAGLTSLNLLKEINPYPQLNKIGNMIRNGLKDIFPKTSVQGLASMFCMYVSEDRVSNYEEAITNVKKEQFLKYQRQMLEKGVFHPPSQYECNFVSTTHTNEIIEDTLEKAKQCKL